MKALFVWLVLSVIWGTTWLFIKVGLQDLPPVSYAAARFVIAAAILLAVMWVQGIRFPRPPRDWLLLAATGTLAFAVNYGLLFWGEQHISSGLAAVLQATIPAFGLVIAHYHLPDERITFLKLCGIGLGLAGVAVIFSDQLQIAGRLALWGSVAVVVGALAVAYANVLVKAHGRHLHPATLAAGQMLCGLVPLLLFGAITEGNPLKFRWTLVAVGSLLYLAVVGSVVAFLLYYWLLKHMDVTKTLLISLVTPPVALALGWLVLGERLMWRTLLGGVCILLGITIVLTRRKAASH